jgi:hypothetical protein
MNKQEDRGYHFFPEIIFSKFPLLCSRKGLNGGFDQIQFLQLNKINFLFRIRQNKQTANGRSCGNVSGTCIVVGSNSNQIEFKVIPVSINNSTENIAQCDHSPFVSMDNRLNSRDFYNIRKEITKRKQKRKQQDSLPKSEMAGRQSTRKLPLPCNNITNLSVKVV